MPRQFSYILKVLLWAFVPLILISGVSKAQDAALSQSSMEQDSQYLDLLKIQQDHRNLNQEFAQKLHIIDNDPYSYFKIGQKFSNAEFAYINKQLDLTRDIIKYLETLEKGDESSLLVAQLEAAYISARLERPLKSVADLNRISEKWGDKLLQTAPATYEEILELHARLLSQAQEPTAAVNKAETAFNLRKERLLGADFNSESAHQTLSLGTSMKGLAEYYKQDKKQNKIPQLFQKTITETEEFLSGCKIITDYDACNLNRTIITSLHRSASSFYTSHSTRNKNNALLVSPHLKHILNYEVDKCLNRKKKGKTCNIGTLSYTLKDYMYFAQVSESSNEAMSAWEETHSLLNEFFNTDEFLNVETKEMYLEIANKSNQLIRATNFFKENNINQVIVQAVTKSPLELELLSIEGEIRSLPSGSYSSDAYKSSLSKRQTLLKQKASLSERIYGKESSQFRISLESLLTALSHNKSPEAIGIARQIYDLKVESVDKVKSRSTIFALERLFFAISNIEDDARALKEVVPLLEIPGSETSVNYWQNRLSGDYTHGVKAEITLLNYIAKAYNKVEDYNSALNVYLHAYAGVLHSTYGIGYDLYSEKTFESKIGGNSNSIEFDDRTIFYDLIDTFYKVHESELAEGIKSEGIEEGIFSVMQFASQNLTTLAVNRSATKKLAGKSGFENLILQRSSLLASYETFNSKTHSELDFEKITSSNKRRSLEIDELNQEIQKKFPEFFQISRPTSLPVKEAMDLLNDDEAYLLIVSTDTGTHVVALTNDSIDWHVSNWGHDKVSEAVRKLRLTLNQNLNESGNYSTAFDFDTSHALFKELLGPIFPTLRKHSHLYVTATGGLSSIPFATLTSQPVTGDKLSPDVLRDASWIDKDFAIIQIPSIESLKYFRNAKARRGLENTRRKFDGFGAPELEGNLEAKDLSYDKVRATSRSADVKLANLSELRKLKPLNGARKELSALRRALRIKASENSTRLGAAATETAVKSSNLSNTNIIAFATHGLLAGEVASVSEPGLVFTPPAIATKLDDGYLTATEIVSLNLDADWVILSACNTASGENTGEAGLSGLAQAFLHAGADRLLASHWPVRDDIASTLVPDTISRIETSSSLSRAEAFNAAVKFVRENENDASFSHPAAWAPLVLIGDR